MGATIQAGRPRPVHDIHVKHVMEHVLRYHMSAFIGFEPVGVDTIQAAVHVIHVIIHVEQTCSALI